MANELQEKLDAILEDKNTNLLPEHLKAGITCLGVEGSLEGGTTTGVKLFETIEEMQVDTTSEEGDLAVVYRNEIQNANVDSVFSKAIFPATVVLPTAITDYVEVRYQAVDSSVMFDCWGQIDSSMFMMNCYTENDNIRIQYESSDGITYTRVDSGDETIDFGVEITYGYPEYWNDVIGYFIQVGSNYFDGLYEYKEYTNLGKIYNFDWANAPTTASGSSPYLNNSSVILDTSIFDELDELLNFKTRGFLKFFTIYDGSYYYCIPCSAYRSYSPYMYYDYTNNKMYVTMDTARCKTNVGLEDPVIMYKVNKTTKEITNIDMMTLTSNVIFTFNNGADKMCLICEMPFNNECFVADYYIVPQNENNSLIQNVSAMYTGNGIGVGKDYMNQTMSTTNVNEFGYILTSTQLNATAEYVYEKEFYGKDGIETGILGANPDNSFMDTNAKLIYDLQTQYDTMEPIVLTDENKTINSSIYFIPEKSDGTPLYDTSAITSFYGMFKNFTYLRTIPRLNTSNAVGMSEMFQNCKQLKTIPLIDTSKVTNMNNMFYLCSELVEVPLLDMSSAIYTANMFSSCPLLKYVPPFNISNVTQTSGMFGGCSSITSVPLLNTSKVSIMGYMFSGCTLLVDVPLFDTSSATNMDGMFNNCSSLSDESLNNILQMCANAVNITENKTLSNIGLTEAQATKCKTLSNYAAFTAAGWTA